MEEEVCASFRICGQIMMSKQLVAPGKWGLKNAKAGLSVNTVMVTVLGKAHRISTAITFKKGRKPLIDLKTI